MDRIAFTGSFDPPHEGHKYVVETAMKIGFEVVVIVANNPNKAYSKSLSDRLDDCEAFFGVVCIASDSDNIGSIIVEQGCVAIIRGLRNTKDFDYEQTVSDFNREANGLETIYIPCPESLRGVNSTRIREETR